MGLLGLQRWAEVHALPNSCVWHRPATQGAAARAGTQLKHWGGTCGLCGQVLQSDQCLRLLHHWRPKCWTCSLCEYISSRSPTAIKIICLCEPLLLTPREVSLTHSSCPVGLGDGTQMLLYVLACSLLTPPSGGILLVGLVSLQLHWGCSTGCQ